MSRLTRDGTINYPGKNIESKRYNSRDTRTNKREAQSRHIYEVAAFKLTYKPHGRYLFKELKRTLFSVVP